MADLPIEITKFPAAMQTGRAAAAELEALFSADAEYVEPFSGAAQRHRGKAAVMAAMAQGWQQPMPDMRLTVDAAETRGDTIDLSWTCHSPVLPGGKGHGRNRFVMRDGLIVELVTTVSGGAA